MKKIVTIGVIVLIGLALAFFLFKISPQETASISGGYNSSLTTEGVTKLESVPDFDKNVDKYQGNPNAKNVLIEYADFQCPACASYSELLKEVPKSFEDTVFVYRYFPLTQIHKNATISALAAEAAGAQGKYWEMHDILFAKQTEWENMSDPLNTFAGYAQTVGVTNIEQFKTDITSKKYLAPIQKNYAESLGLSLPGTPSMFFNGHALQNDTLEGLKTQSQKYLNK